MPLFLLFLPQFALKRVICDPFDAYGVLTGARGCFAFLFAHLLSLSMSAYSTKIGRGAPPTPSACFHRFVDVFLEEHCKLHPFLFSFCKNSPLRFQLAYIRSYLVSFSSFHCASFRNNSIAWDCLGCCLRPRCRVALQGFSFIWSFRCFFRYFSTCALRWTLPRATLSPFPLPPYLCRFYSPLKFIYHFKYARKRAKNVRNGYTIGNKA